MKLSKNNWKESLRKPKFSILEFSVKTKAQKQKSK